MKGFQGWILFLLLSITVFSRDQYIVDGSTFVKVATENASYVVREDKYIAELPKCY